MTIHHLQHVSYEKPGYIESWARNRDLKQTRILVSNPDAFPEPDSDDLVVVLGGPMSVYEEDAYPWLRREKRFLQDCLNQAFLLPGQALGLQFHLEITEDIVRTLLSRSSNRATEDSHPDPVPPPDGPGYDRLHKYTHLILDAFTRGKPIHPSGSRS